MVEAGRADNTNWGLSGHHLYEWLLVYEWHLVGDDRQLQFGALLALDAPASLKARCR
jgi:hypothetical protein